VIANSMSGCATLWLTEWQQTAHPEIEKEIEAVKADRGEFLGLDLANPGEAASHLVGQATLAEFLSFSQFSHSLAKSHGQSSPAPC
jgi:hypothetical protein